MGDSVHNLGSDLGVNYPAGSMSETETNKTSMSEGQGNKTSKSESEIRKDFESEKSRSLASERICFGYVDCLWWLFNTAVLGLVIACLNLIILPWRKHHDVVFGPVFTISLLVYTLSLVTWYVVYIHEPDKCLGKVGKSIIEVITVTSAVAIRKFLGYKIVYLLALVGFTAHFHVILQFRRVAYDVSVWDILLGSLMQIVVYLMGGHIYLLVVGLVLCGVVIFYRAITYSSPIVPVQEEQELQPC